MVYVLGYWLIWLIAKILYRFRIEGRRNIPQGGTIIAPNHVSYWDPPLVGAAIDSYQVYFMAKRQLFRFPIFGMVLKMIHTFPVDRKRIDIAAFRKALRVLNREKTLVVFPEGGRGKGGRLKPPQPGIAWIAHKTKCPVVPTLVVNTHRIRAFPRVTVRFGSPIYFETDQKGENEKSRYYNFAQKIMEGIMKLDREGQYRYEI
ncbi:MAG: lysophospholipid acyltransferase family protein [bacterium]